MSNPLHPERLSPEERLAELTAILAAGVIRLQLRKSSDKSQKKSQFSLDFDAYQSGAVSKPEPLEKGK